MEYRPRLVANALLHKARSAGESLTHLKLQKLMFFMQAWGLALHDQKVIDELPEAWPYGPVFAGLYHELKPYGSGSIVGYLMEPDLATGKPVSLVPNPGDTQFYQLLDQVWDRYGKLTAGQLSSLSHVPGGPWDAARKSNMRNMSQPEITAFYRSQLQGNVGQV